MCYVNRTLCGAGLVITNDPTMIKVTDPKFGLSVLRSNSKVLAIN